MKRIALIAFTLLSFASAAQPTQTIFGPGTRVSGFAAPIMEFGNIDGDFSFMFGGGGGLLINSFWLGGYGQALLNEIGPNPESGLLVENDPNIRMNFAHGGLWIGNSFFARRAVHLVTSFKTGWGAVSFSKGDGIDLSEDSFDDQVFVLTPEIGIELNMTRFMRISLTGGYRFVSGVEAVGYSDDDFSQLTGQLAIQFGGFGWMR